MYKLILSSMSQKAHSTNRSPIHPSSHSSIHPPILPSFHPFIHPSIYVSFSFPQDAPWSCWVFSGSCGPPGQPSTFPWGSPKRCVPPGSWPRQSGPLQSCPQQKPPHWGSEEDQEERADMTDPEQSVNGLPRSTKLSTVGGMGLCKWKQRFPKIA